MKQRKRKAWLITWESTRADYMAHLGRPGVVAILSARLSEGIVQKILQALYCSESRLTLFEKLNIGSTEARTRYFRSYGGELRFGQNPNLVARRVTDLRIERTGSDEQTVHCKSEPQYEWDSANFEPKLVMPERSLSYTDRDVPHPASA